MAILGDCDVLVELCILTQLLLLALLHTAPGEDISTTLLLDFAISGEFVETVCIISKELCSGTRLTEKREILRILRLSSGVETTGEMLEAVHILQVC